MTATDIVREAQWAGRNRHSMALSGVRATLARLYSAVRPTLSCRSPPSVARHPAFTGKFNARLVAVGMAATMHRRMAR